jgi:cysteine desulfurase
MADKPSMVYLDNNSTTELSHDVAQVVTDMILHNIYGNPSARHEAGVKIKTIIDAARYGVAQSLGCSSEEIIFTSGGTESNNLAMRGTFFSDASSPNELVISAGEHASVYNTAEALAGVDRMRIIPLLPNGSLDLAQAERLITEDVALVSVMLANNITGNVYPIKEIVKLAHSVGALVHCDAVQAYGKIPVNVQDLGVDLLSISGHKVHALPGVGALFVRKGIKLHPTLTGGGQESAIRAGTENYIGIASLATVANDITRRDGNMEPGFRDVFETGILKRIPNVTINGKDIPRVPNTSSITFEGIHATAMLTALAEQGVYASAGSACSSGSAKPPRTLISMELSERNALSTIRFSFSSMSKLMDVALAIEACVKCASTLRQGAETGES